MRSTATVVVLVVLVAVTRLGSWAQPQPVPGGRNPDVIINVPGGQSQKVNIAIPNFSVVAGTDSAGHSKTLATVAGNDLTVSGFFSVVAGSEPVPVNNSDELRRRWSEFAAAGAQAAVHGLLTIRGERLEAEMRLYDLTSPDLKVIASKKFDAAAPQARRLAHKIADEIVLQFTGEPGIADTKIAYVVGRPGAKEILFADYDGAGAVPATRNGSINLMPMWSPDARSIAFTSFMNGYPDLFRMFPFEPQRPVQTLAAFAGINSSPAWSPDGRFLALTLSLHGNPEIYVLTVATGKLDRLTRHAAIDTEPAWSPTGREIAFVSDRAGRPHIHVMDASGTNVRQVTSGGFHTQPRWSPKGNIILYTQRQGAHDLWAIDASGANPRPITAGPGDNQGASWAPDGRHIAFQSNRSGRWQLYFMLLDGSALTPIPLGVNDATSPTWSPRLP